MLGCARRVVGRTCSKQHLKLSGKICVGVTIRTAPSFEGKRTYWGAKAETRAQTTETRGFGSGTNAGESDDEPVMHDSAADAERKQNEIESGFSEIDEVTLGTDLSGTVEDAVTSATDVAPAMLEYGYYPTDLLRQGIEIAHNSTGLPYWIVIVGGTLALRCGLLPLEIATISWGRKRKTALDAVAQLLREYNAISQSMKTKGDADGSKVAHMRKLESRMRAVGLEYGIVSRDSLAGNKFKMFGFPVGIFILSLSVLITSVIGLNGMGDFCTDWAIGGPTWFINLNLPDPTYSLPMLCGVTQLIGAYFSKSSVEDEKKAEFMRTEGIFFLVTIPLVGILPSGTGLFLTTSTGFNALSSGLLSVPKIRKALSLPPLPSSKL